MLAVLLILLFVLLFANIPVFIALTASSSVVLAQYTDLVQDIIVQRMFAGINKFSMLAVPFFIFAANVMNRGGLGSRLVNFVNTLVGHLRGGMAFTVAITCMFLGAVSGSSPATVIIICSLMLPVMLENGYGRGFSVGLIMAASSVAVIIPPSIGMIVYGTVTDTSIGSLFMAGFIPGILYCGVFMIFSYVYARRRKLQVKKKATCKEKWKAFKDAIWALGIPIIIIGGIYGGIFTAIESAGIAAVYSIIVSCFVYKEMSFKDLIKEAYKSAVGTAQVMIIMAGACVFAWVLTKFQVPTMLTQTITSLANSRFAILLSMNIIMLIAGMFIDAASIQTIMGPLFLPIATSYGVDPVHLGIIMVVNGAIGMFTPPFGLNLFVAAGVTRIPLKELMRTVGIWVVLSIIALLLITYIPGISMLLPNLIQN